MRPVFVGVGTLIDRFEPAECANCFEAAGYDASWSENALELTLGWKNLSLMRHPGCKK